jgi:hypothetical protein
MAVVDRSIVLPASADAVWAAVQTPGAFRLVTRGLLVMPAWRGRVEPWQEGESGLGWVLLFGVVPLSRHHIHLVDLDHRTRTLRSNEHGGVIRRWDHDITVEPMTGGRCRYRDRIEIDAGALTPVVAAWARFFYWARQRRWVGLAAALTAIAPVAETES